jgi:hypothetical protein
VRLLFLRNALVKSQTYSQPTPHWTLITEKNSAFHSKLGNLNIINPAFHSKLGNLNIINTAFLRKLGRKKSNEVGTLRRVNDLIMNQASSHETSRWPASDDFKVGAEEQLTKPSQDVDFQFLTFSNFSDTKAKETKSKVRSHVMHGVHHKKKNGRQRVPKGSIELNIYSLPRLKLQATQQHADSVLPNAALTGPDRLGAGRNDPFQRYPIRMNHRALEIYDHRKISTRDSVNSHPLILKQSREDPSVRCSRQ